MLTSPSKVKSVKYISKMANKNNTLPDPEKTPTGDLHRDKTFLTSMNLDNFFMFKDYKVDMTNEDLDFNLQKSGGIKGFEQTNSFKEEMEGKPVDVNENQVLPYEGDPQEQLMNKTK